MSNTACAFPWTSGLRGGWYSTSVPALLRTLTRPRTSDKYSKRRTWARRSMGRCSGGVRCSARSSPRRRLGAPIAPSTSTSSRALGTWPLPTAMYMVDPGGDRLSCDNAQAVLGRQRSAWSDDTHVNAAGRTGLPGQGGERGCPQRSPRRPQREHRNLRWHTQAQGESERAQPWIHIQESAFLRACRRLLASGRRRRAERQAVQAHRKRRDEAGRAPLAAPEREAYLTAMGVACEAELDAQGRGPRKRIGIVREQDVGDVGPHQPFDAAQHGGRFTRAGALPLVVDPDQIETAAAPGQFHTLLSQHVHAVARQERLRPRFHTAPPFVVAVAGPDAQGHSQPAQLGDTLLEGVAPAGDDVTGQHGEIGLHGINEVDGTSKGRTGHEVPNVEIAQMHDAQPIQAGR